MKQGELGRSGMGFSCCNMRSDKNYAHLVPYPSGAMTLKRVLSCRAHHALFGSTSQWAKFQLVVELRLEMYSAAMVTKVARFLMARNGGK